MAQAPFLLIVFLCFHRLVLFACCAQSSISTTITVPPLQWINLTNHISSGTTSPPALRDATIGYDETRCAAGVFPSFARSKSCSRSLIVFGGESDGGNALDTTYLYVRSVAIASALPDSLSSLNLDTLVWSVPNPPDSLVSKPAPRSGAVGGCDFAAS